MKIIAPLRALAPVLCVVALLVPPAAAQFCDPQWGTTYQQAPLDGAPGAVYDLIEFDFGTGAQLIAGGSFRTAGTIAAQNIARSTGTQSWEPIGGGLPGIVNCLDSFNDGAGLKLYAGGDFAVAGYQEPGSGMRRWNGSAWESIAGPDGIVTDTIVWNDGNGNALYAAGRFATAGGQTVNNIAKWTGLGWFPLGTGIPGGYINKLAIYDSAQGSRLVAVGAFVQAGSTFANNLALWNGTTWSALNQLANTTEIIGVGQYQKPGVRELWFCTTDFSNPLRRWDGSSIQNVNLSPIGPSRVNSIHQATEGGVQVLLLGGRFMTSNNLRNLVKWNGSNFATVVTNNTTPSNTVYATTYHRFPGDASARLAVGGTFSSFAPHFAGGTLGFTGPVMTTTPDRAAFTAMQTTLTVPGVRAFGIGPSPDGDALYAGGQFGPAPNAPGSPRYFARWQNNAWQPAAPGLDGPVAAMARFRGDLIVGGSFYGTDTFPSTTYSYVARFDGTTWHSMPGFGPINVGVASPVQSLTPATVNGQEYVYAASLASPRSVARWDGNTWTAINPLGNAPVNDLAFGDIGAGPTLYGAGYVITSPSQQVFGKEGAIGWVPVAAGQRYGTGNTIGIFDLGSGPQLIGGGYAGIQPADDPQVTLYYPVVTVINDRWVPLGTNMSGTAYDLAMFDDGDGPALYAAGDLRITGQPEGQPSGRALARFDGTAWQLVGGDLNGPAFTLFPMQDSPPRLLIGGDFSVAGSATALGIGEWLACPPCPADFDRSGGVDGSDVESFFTAWEAADPAADVNADGGVDGGDVAYFFIAWEAGGC